MRQAIIGGLVAVLVTAGAVGLWWKFRPQAPEPETIEQLQYRLFLTTTGSGHAGKVATGPPGNEWVGYNPWFRDGALQVYAPQAGILGSTRGPVCLLLLRLAPGAPYSLGGGLATDGKSIEISVGQYSAEGKAIPVVWRAESLPDIPSAPASSRFKEAFTVAGKLYPLDKGRVFLVDLTATPPAVTQAQGDLVELFRTIEGDISEEVLKFNVQRLAMQEKPVEAFLEAIPKP